MSKYIVVDLETTYVESEKKNRIIEIGFVIIHDNKVINEYSKLINPGTVINNFVEQFTNIKNKDLEDAPFFKDIYQEFIPQFKDHTIIAHQAQVDMKTLNDELDLLELDMLDNKTIDTVELSKILLPEAQSYRLTDLAISQGITVKNAHRALADAKMTAELFLKLKTRLSNLPQGSLYHLKELTPYFVSDLYDLITGFMTKNIDHASFHFYNDLPFNKPDNYNSKEINLPNYNQLSEVFYRENNGLLSNVINDYKERSGQIEISDLIYNLLEKENNGLIEAATGIGKSVGYLLPAIYEARNTGERIVISTYTTQLQNQLVNNDIALLKRSIPFDFNVQVLKGKKNYLDISRFYKFMKNKRNDTYPLVILKAKIVVWLTETETGLFTDLNIEPNMEQYLYDIQTIKRESKSSYHTFAYNKAFTAQILVVNHSLLLTDIHSNYKYIPNYKKIIIDEAHRFTHLLQREESLLLSSLELEPYLNYLTKSREINDIDPLMENIKELMNLFLSRSKVNKETLIEHVYSNLTNEQESNQDIIDLLKIIIQNYKHILNNTDDKVVHKELTHSRLKFIDLLFNIEMNLPVFIEFKEEKKKVSWTIYTEKKHNKNVHLKNFYETKKSIVFLSATLTVRGKFDYILNELGLEDTTYTTSMNSPFNLKEQTKLIVPTDFPNVKDEVNYVAALSELIYSINNVTKGRIMILFTSYKMLKQVYNLLLEFMDETTLLAQGITTDNREKLLKEFKTAQPAILLGTASFWEGVDIKGDTLSCLILTRLPFQQIDDSVFKIKSEQLIRENKTPFFDYALPSAVLKFKQGIGRLIRTENDRGIILVLDNRLQNANYKKFFTESILPIEVLQQNTKELIEEIDNWL